MKLYQPIYDPSKGILNPAGWSVRVHEVEELDTFGAFGIKNIRLKRIGVTYQIGDTERLYTTEEAASDYINKKGCPPTLYDELLEQKRKELMA